jgi:hypothetical protein
MRGDIKRGYGSMLLAVLVFLALAFFLFFKNVDRSLEGKFGPCRPVASLGPNVVVCAKNLHAYHWQSGRYVDMGRLTLMPRVPSDS